MKMETENDTNRVGIYTQVSVEATAAGEGLAPQGEKSPVATIQNRINLIKSEIKSECENEEDKQIITSARDSTTETTENTSPVDRVGLEVDEGDHHPLEGNQENNSQDQQGGSITGDDGHSNYSGASSKLKPGTRGYERDKLNRATKLKVFPRSERHFGKERWGKAIKVLQDIGFVNWEINVMLEGLDSLAEKRDLTEAITKQSHRKKRNALESEVEKRENVKVPRLEDKKLDAIKRKDPGVISGILTPFSRFPKHEKEQNLSNLDLRVNIGDASHPSYHILPENRNQLQDELGLLLMREDKDQNSPIGIVNSFYSNHTLLVECLNETTVEVLKSKLSKLNRLWRGANFQICPRIGVRQDVQIYIPYPGLETKEILGIIKNQNKLNTEAWHVNKREDLDDGVCLDVEVDETTNLRILNDQDDLFFLLTRATVKVPVKDEE